jgi:hypothetical protein
MSGVGRYAEHMDVIYYFAVWNHEYPYILWVRTVPLLSVRTPSRRIISKIDLQSHRLSLISEQLNKYGVQSAADGETRLWFALHSFHTFTVHVVNFCAFAGTADPWMAFTSSSPTGLANLVKISLDVSPHGSPLCSPILCDSICISSGLGIWYNNFK